jgi:hypothetical protein
MTIKLETISTKNLEIFTPEMSELKIKKILLKFKDNMLSVNGLNSSIMGPNQVKLYKKTEFHITILGNNLAKKFYKLNKKNYEAEFLKLLMYVQKITNDSKIELLNEFSMIHKNDRYSCIQHIETPILEQITNYLKQEFKLDIGAPFPHITIYKQKENYGIGLDSVAEYEQWVIEKNIQF